MTPEQLSLIHQIKWRVPSYDREAIDDCLAERAELLGMVGEALSVSTISSPSAMSSALVRLRPKLAAAIEKTKGTRDVH